MMHSYRGRMIVYNSAVFFAVFTLISFIIVQGYLLFQIKSTEKQMVQGTIDAQMMLNETYFLTGNTESFTQKGLKKADTTVHTLTQMMQMNTCIFELNGHLLSGSSDFSLDHFKAVFSEAKQTKCPVTQLTLRNNQNWVTTLAPLFINETPIAIIAFSSPIPPISQTLILLCIGAMLIGFVMVAYETRHFANHLIQPIEDLTGIAEEINAGNYHASIYYLRDDEIGRLTDVFNQMIANINSVIHQLESERKRLAGVLASLDDGLLALDGEGNVITANAYIRTYFNVVNPKTIYDFQFQSFLRDIFQDLKEGKTHISMEVDCNDRDLMIIGSPITEAGFEENYMIVIRNMTASNRIRKDQQKFISSVSHELRTPLTTIIGYTDMILRRNISQNILVNQALSTINREGHRLLRLVDDLLNVNRLDTPEFSIKKMNLNPQDLLNDVVEQMKIKSLEKEIDIILKTDSDLPDLLGDYDRLRQVFINIIHNGIKYSDSGDIIDIIATADDEWLTVSIRDYGVGIPEQELERVFSAFYRVEEDRSRSENEGGAGLGLYLVRQIVTRHQGTVDIESVPQEGTNVTVKLPVIAKTIQEGILNEA